MKNNLRRLIPTVLAAIVFTLTTSAYAAYTENVVNSVATVGGLPVWREGLVADSGGNFYGFSEGGGAANLGAVFELSPGATGWTQTILYSFTGGQDGAGPAFGAVPLMDAKGNLYGEDSGGGAYLKGEIYELSPSSSGWTKTVLYSFTGLTDGDVPVPSLIFDAAGNLYGATIAGGIYDEGVIFKLSPSSGGWNETVLYAFEGRATGFFPIGALALDSAGRLYGMTYFGGPSSICSASGCGTIFQLSPPTTGTVWTYKRVHAFDYYDGGQPTEANNLVFDAAGNLFGCTSFGGNTTAGAGVIFKLSPTTAGAWKETVIHSFAAGNDGYEPNSITFDASGHLWGTVYEGGSGGYGTVFEMTPTANGHLIVNTVYSFPSTPAGDRPTANVRFHNAGNVYGTTSLGRTSLARAFFQLSPAGSIK